MMILQTELNQIIKFMWFITLTCRLISCDLVTEKNSEAAYSGESRDTLADRNLRQTPSYADYARAYMNYDPNNSSSWDLNDHHHPSKSSVEEYSVINEHNSVGFNLVKEETIEEVLELEPEAPKSHYGHSLVSYLTPEVAYSNLNPKVEGFVLGGDLFASETEDKATSSDNKLNETFATFSTTTTTTPSPAASITAGVIPTPGSTNSSAPEASNKPEAKSTEVIDDTEKPTKQTDGVSSRFAKQLDREEVSSADDGDNFIIDPKSRTRIVLSPSYVRNKLLHYPTASPLTSSTNRHYHSREEFVHKSHTHHRHQHLYQGGYNNDYDKHSKNEHNEHVEWANGKYPVIQTGTRSPSHDDTYSSSASTQKNGGLTRLLFVPSKLIVSEDILTPPPAIVVAHQQVGSGQRGLGKPDPRCPKAGNTTFEHPGACDKYYLCEYGLMSEQTCPNGLVYGTRDTVTDYCVYRWTATCGERSIPNPISSPGCRWQYGIFTIQGSPKCSQNYYVCTDGQYQVKRCQLENQVYDDRSKSCQHSRVVGCTNGAIADFHCPPDDQGNTYWPFPRYFLNERALIHCVNDKPELVRCNRDERVDPTHLHCVPISSRAQINKLDERDDFAAREDMSQDMDVADERRVTQE